MASSKTIKGLIFIDYYEKNLAVLHHRVRDYYPLAVLEEAILLIDHIKTDIEVVF